MDTKWEQNQKKTGIAYGPKQYLKKEDSLGGSHFSENIKTRQDIRGHTHLINLWPYSCTSSQASSSTTLPFTQLFSPLFSLPVLLPFQCPNFPLVPFSLLLFLAATSFYTSLALSLFRCLSCPCILSLFSSQSPGSQHYLCVISSPFELTRFLPFSNWISSQCTYLYSPLFYLHCPTSMFPSP